MSLSHNNYKINFYIFDEESLSDFWSYLIFQLHIEESEQVYDGFARLYNIINDLINDISDHLIINIDTNLDNYQILIKNLSNKLLLAFLSKFKNYYYIFLVSDESIQFRISKNDTNRYCNLPNQELVVKKKFLYNDYEELINIVDKFIAYNYNQNFNHMNIDELRSYKSLFSNYSNVSIQYENASNLSSIIAELSIIISLYEDKCIEKNTFLRPFLEGFVKNLQTIHQTMLQNKDHKFNSLDDSFGADLKQIKILLELYDEEEVSDDEIEFF